VEPFLTGGRREDHAGILPIDPVAQEKEWRGQKTYVIGGSLVGQCLKHCQ